MKPWEEAGVSRRTWYRKRADFDLRRRAAQTPAAMMGVIEAAGGITASEPRRLAAGLLADILLKLNDGQASGSEMSIAVRLMGELGLFGQAAADGGDFDDFM